MLVLDSRDILTILVAYTLLSLVAGILVAFLIAAAPWRIL